MSSPSSAPEAPTFAVKANRFFYLNIYFFVFIVLAFFYLQRYLESPPYAVLGLSCFILVLALHSNRTAVLSFYTEYVVIKPSLLLSKHTIHYQDIVSIEQLRSIIIIQYKTMNTVKTARFSTAHMHKNMSEVALSYLQEKATQHRNHP